MKNKLLAFEFDFLRLGDEPTRHYDEATIHRVLMQSVNPFMDRLESFYLAWGNAPQIVQQPKKIVFTSEGIRGDWRVMPCLIDRFEGKLIKAVKVIGTNAEERTIKDKICVGKALLIDEYDNHVKASFDVCALSSFRTAAISALAYKHAAGHCAEQLVIIGAGRIGFYLAEILSQWLNVQSIIFHDQNTKRAEALAARFDALALELEPALEHAKAVFVCTDSQSPVLNAGNCRRLRFISSVGADADNLSEIESDLLEDFTIVSESRQNIEVGDMARWQKAGLLSENNIVELADVVSKRVKLSSRSLFISTGTAVQDALVCSFIHDGFSDN